MYSLLSVLQRNVSKHWDWHIFMIKKWKLDQKITLFDGDVNRVSVGTRSRGGESRNFSPRETRTGKILPQKWGGQGRGLFMSCEDSPPYSLFFSKEIIYIIGLLNGVQLILRVSFLHLLAILATRFWHIQWLVEATF